MSESWKARPINTVRRLGHRRGRKRRLVNPTAPAPAPHISSTPFFFVFFSFFLQTRYDVCVSLFVSSRHHSPRHRGVYSCRSAPCRDRPVLASKLPLLLVALASRRQHRSTAGLQRHGGSAQRAAGVLLLQPTGNQQPAAEQANCIAQAVKHKQETKE